MINQQQVESYIQQCLPKSSSLLEQMEAVATEEQVPIIQKSAAQALKVLLMAKQPKRILEIGTAIGYSAIWLAQAAPHARITTMEIDPKRVSQALVYLDQAGVREQVEVIEGDACEGLPDHYKFDVIFIDAAKGQYRTYFDLYFPLLETDGLLICDNVLFRGMVAGAVPVEQKYERMIEQLRDFNRFLIEHPQLEVSILPVGDGLAVAVKKERA